MRSVEVVFPASIWAMIPMLRVYSSCDLPAMRVSVSINPAASAPLPTIMGEGLVGLGHAVHVLFPLHGAALPVGGIQQLLGQLVHHAFARPGPRVQQQPADGQGLPSVGIHFHRYLIVGAAHAPRFHFQHRLDVFHGLIEHLQRLVMGLLADLFHGAVKDALRGRALAVPHHRINELLHQVAVIDRVTRYRAPRNESFARHSLSYFCAALGRLAPYLERPCLRLSTPAASRVPRMMWYRTPGRSFTRPPRIKTMECSCRL